jgi:rhodanese-related sulfurtransferase
MAGIPLLSPELFDTLRQRGILPFTRLGDLSRASLGDGVRAFSLRAGESLATAGATQRIHVLSGTVRIDGEATRLDPDSTRTQEVLTGAGESRLRAESDAILLLADTDFLDILASWEEITRDGAQRGHPELMERLLKVRHCRTFRRLPLEHVAEALGRMSLKPVKAGDNVVSQGEKGDAFYLIWSGRAEVWRADLYDDAPRLVDEIGPGEAFGDESLLTGASRNATVRMVEDGELLNLSREDFLDLVSRPLIEEVTAQHVPALQEQGWKLVDVRYAEEFEDGFIPGALNLPLPDLRRREAELLDGAFPYVVVCRSGKRSTVGAYLLKQRGYRVVTMKEGMNGWVGETTSA